MVPALLQQHWFLHIMIMDLIVLRLKPAAAILLLNLIKQVKQVLKISGFAVLLYYLLKAV